jgi:hypothetical protein
VVPMVVPKPTPRSASRRAPNLAACCSTRYSTASARWRYTTWPEVLEEADVAGLGRTPAEHGGQAPSSLRISCVELARSGTQCWPVESS